MTKWQLSKKPIPVLAINGPKSPSYSPVAQTITSRTIGTQPEDFEKRKRAPPSQALPRKLAKSQLANKAVAHQKLHQNLPLENANPHLRRKTNQLEEAHVKNWPQYYPSPYHLQIPHPLRLQRLQCLWVPPPLKIQTTARTAPRTVTWEMSNEKSTTSQIHTFWTWGFLMLQICSTSIWLARHRHPYQLQEATFTTRFLTGRKILTFLALRQLNSQTQTTAESTIRQVILLQQPQPQLEWLWL